MKKIRVLIADDHAAVRAGIRLLLESQPDMEVVGEAKDGRESLVQAKKLKPDVILMDITMPGMGVVEATQAIKEAHPQVQVLALTMHEDAAYFFQMLQAGASGYVVKGADPSEVLSGIRVVSQDKAYLFLSLARKLVYDYLARVQTGCERGTYARVTTRPREGSPSRPTGWSERCSRKRSNGWWGTRRSLAERLGRIGWRGLGERVARSRSSGRRTRRAKPPSRLRSQRFAKAR